jgi:4-hydroxyphenylpyruvate dioxygenase
MNIERIAINSVSTRQQGLEEALAAYSAAGFRNVEFVLPLVKEWLGQGHSIGDLRSMLAEYQLRPIGGFETHVVCFGPPEVQRANHALHLENARLIHELGGGTLVVGTDGPPHPSLESLGQVAQTFRELARAIEGMDVRVAVEFNWSPIIKSLKSAVLLCKQVSHPQVGVLFDPAHYYTTTTKLADLTAETVRWITHVHMNDMRDKPGDLSNCNSDRVLPGEGVLELPALIGALEQHGYTGYYAIEMFNDDLWALPVDEAARRCYASMRDVLTE